MEDIQDPPALIWKDFMLKHYPAAESWSDCEYTYTLSELTKKLTQQTGNDIFSFEVADFLLERNYIQENLGEKVVYLIG